MALLDRPRRTKRAARHDGRHGAARLSVAHEAGEV